MNLKENIRYNVIEKNINKILKSELYPSKKEVEFTFNTLKNNNVFSLSNDEFKGIRELIWTDGDATYVDEEIEIKNYNTLSIDLKGHELGTGGLISDFSFGNIENEDYETYRDTYQIENASYIVKANYGTVLSNAGGSTIAYGIGLLSCEIYLNSINDKKTLKKIRSAIVAANNEKYLMGTVIPTYNYIIRDKKEVFETVEGMPYIKKGVHKKTK